MKVEKIIYDVVVIGAGPAGLTAAIYTSRGNMKTLIVERGIYGGQLQKTAEIENYPAFKTVLGPDLAQNMYEHAVHFGATYAYGDVQSIEKQENTYQIQVGNAFYQTKSIIIATGADYKKLGVPGEEQLAGRGVSYCAVCDGAFFKQKEIVVIGGGDSAVEEAHYLTKFADKVTLIHRRDSLRAQKILQKRLFDNPKIDVIWNTTIKEIIGEERVTGVRITDNETNEERIFSCDGVFVYVGMNPLSHPFESLGITNPSGCIPTNDQMETTMPGIFAAGDVREKTLRQVITAAGDGSIAAQSAQKYIEELNEAY